MSEVVTRTFGSLKMVVLKGEHSRTYIYPNKSEFSLEKITHLHVKKNPNGTHTHRLRNAAGDMYYVRPGWIAIKFPGLAEWTL